MSFKKFITSKLALATIMFTILYQLIMVVVYLPGYQHFTDHIDNLTISVANEDKNKNGNKLENSIISGLKNKKLPKIKKVSLNKAKEDLKEHKTLMVIEIPKNATYDLSHGHHIYMKYYHDSYNDQGTEKTAQLVQQRVNGSLNETFAKLSNTKVLTKIMMNTQGKQIVQQQMQQVLSQNPLLAQDPSSMQKIQGQVINKVTKEMSNKAQKLLITNPVKYHFINISDNEGDISKNLGIMFMGLGCFISVMAAELLAIKAYRTSIEKGSGRWKSFMYYELLYLVVAFLSPALSVLLFKLITGVSFGAALGIYGQNVLLTFVSSQLTSMATFSLGRLGILINLPLALVQTLISGAILPYRSLPILYRILHDVLPLPYNYANNISILSGVNRSGIPKNDFIVVIMGLIYFLITLGILIFKFRKTKKRNEDPIKDH